MTQSASTNDTPHPSVALKPASGRLIISRDKLLEQTMRPAGLPFPIASEYPIVLDPAADFSLCLAEGDQILAHVTLWPRVLRNKASGQTVNVGLIGNVATAPSHQGRGLMRQLFEKIDQVAGAKDLSALILWSDLVQFYQNLGFRSLGTEWRLTFPATKNIAAVRRQDLPELLVNPNTRDLNRMLSLRYGTASTLDRSTREFARLLTIPASLTFVWRRQSQIERYYIVGKGYDLQGVVHEWGGAEKSDTVATDVGFIAAFLELEQILLLAPGDLTHGPAADLPDFASSRERHPMAFVRHLAAGEAELDSCFIWGLDSI